MNNQTKRVLAGVGQGILIMLILYFMSRYVLQQITILDFSELHISIPLLILGQVGIVVGLSGIPFGSWLLAKQLGGQNINPYDIWHAFFVGLVAKYIPGGIWSVTSRTVLYKQYGLSTANSIEVAFWEVSLNVIGAIIMTIPGLTLLAGSSYMGPVIGLFVAFVLGFFVVIALWNTPLIERLRDYIPSVKAMTLQLPIPLVLLVTLFYMGVWLVIGLGFAAIVFSFQPELPLITLPQIVSLYAGGWTVGFLIFIIPGGLGVRDAILLFGLSSLTPSPIPLMAATVVRLMWTAVEVFGLAILSLIKKSRSAVRT